MDTERIPARRGGAAVACGAGGGGNPPGADVGRDASNYRGTRSVHRGRPARQRRYRHERRCHRCRGHCQLLGCPVTGQQAALLEGHQRRTNATRPVTLVMMIFLP